MRSSNHRDRPPLDRSSQNETATGVLIDQLEGEVLMPRDGPVPASALPQSDKPRGLFVSDAELVRMLGCSETRGKAAIRAWEGEGFPQPDPLVGRRYLPAVRTFLDRRYGIGASSSSPLKPDGAESWDDDNV